MRLVSRTLACALVILLAEPSFARNSNRIQPILKDICKKVAAEKEKRSKRKNNECAECTDHSHVSPGSDKLVEIDLSLFDNDVRAQKALHALEKDGRLRQLTRTPLGAKLVSLLQKYSNPDHRQEHFQEYLRALEDTLKLTPEGQEALTCYEEMKHPKLGRTRLVTPESLPDELAFLNPCKDEFIMALALYRDRPGSDKVQRTLIFNPDTPPIQALAAYAHELTHGCNRMSIELELRHMALENRAKRILAPYLKATTGMPAPDRRRDRPEKWLERLRANASDLSKFPQIVSLGAEMDKLALEGSHAGALDEMQAFTVGTKVLQRIATAAPELTCAMYLPHETSDETAQVNGTFPMKLLKSYSDSAGRMEENGCGSNEVAIDLRDKFRLAPRMYNSWVNSRSYQPEHLFQTTLIPRKDEEGKAVKIAIDPVTHLPLLRRDLRRAMLARGFYVAPQTPVKDRALHHLKRWKEKVFEDEKKR